MYNIYRYPNILKQITLWKMTFSRDFQVICFPFNNLAYDSGLCAFRLLHTSQSQTYDIDIQDH